MVLSLMAKVTVLVVALFCLPADAVVAAAAVVVVGALAMAPSMAFSTPLAASSFCVRRVFLASLSLGSSSGWKLLKKRI